MPYFIIILCLLFLSCSEHHSHEYVVVGTYTQKEGHVDGKAEGLYILRFDTHSGLLEITDTLKGCINPSYLSISDDGKNIYAVNETQKTEYNNGGYVSHFKEDKQGRWVLNEHMVSNGAYPCHITINEAKDKLYVSNYLETVSVINLDPNGKMRDTEEIIRISPADSISPRQDAPHPHMTIDGRDSTEIFIADLGRNMIHIYRNKEAEYLITDSILLKPQAGPRHILFNRSKGHLYVLNELNNSIEFFENMTSGTVFNRIQSVNLINTEIKNGFINSAAIHFSPDKKYIYASNRALGGNTNNSISILSVNDTDGTLTWIQNKTTKGKVPRDFIISPDGKHLLIAHQDSDNISVFTRDSKSGMIKDLVFEIYVPTPVCLKFFKNFT